MNLVVHTAQSKQRILSDGGTSGWLLDPSMVKQCRHVVCTRNAFPRERGADVGEPLEQHHSAFLVGRISGLRQLPAVAGTRPRYIVLIDAAAEVSVPNVWDGAKHPVRYLKDDEIKRRGLDLEALKFVAISPPTPSKSGGVDGSFPPLTIQEAKARLAAGLGISPEAIEITIKA